MDLQIVISAIVGEYKEVEKMLTENPTVNASMENNLILRLAARDDQTSIIKQLLKDPRVDPSSDENYALKECIKQNRMELFHLLMNDDRILSNLTSDLFYFAIEHGRYDMARILVCFFPNHNVEFIINFINKINQEITVESNYPTEMVGLLGSLINENFELIDPN